MLYMSNDRKYLFRTEQECYEYEEKIKQDILKKEELKKRQKERYENIIKHLGEVMNEMQDYERDYGSLKLLIDNTNYDYNKIMNLFSDYDMIMGCPDRDILSQFIK